MTATTFAAAVMLSGMLVWPPAPPHSTQPSPPHWLLAFDGRSTNDVAHDPRLRRLITQQVPKAMTTELLGALGGPPNPLRADDGRTVSMSACMPHACPTKGFLWLDLTTGTALGAIYSAPVLRLGSRALTPTALPAAARAALHEWLADLDAMPGTVRFTNAQGSTTTLAAAPFRPTGRFRPPAGGPSFDCATAMAAGTAQVDGATTVARAICRDRDLSALDRRTWQQAEEVRLGHSTRDARRELVEFHNQWRRQRDARCSAAPDLAGCLRAEFTQQVEALRNWLPRSARL